MGPSETDFITREPTLAIGNIRGRVYRKGVPGKDASSEYLNSSLVVQVTAQGATLYDYDEGLQQYGQQGDGWLLEKTKWKGRKVVAADINASQFVLGLSGGTMVVLNLAVGGKEIILQG